MDRRSRITGWLASALVAGLILAACAINPATGQRELSLIGEQQEISMGREYAQETAQSIGLYDHGGLQAFVQQLGAKLAAASERPELPWSFQVVDDPSVNAFALPGGYIFVTRGILAFLGSEAELAGVIGHEIGHVTARHSVNQMSKAQLAQLGLGIGMILSPKVEEFADPLQTGLGLLFLKFGRDDERQSDDLGLRYMSGVGYDPRPMTEVFRVLGDVSRLSGGGRLPNWLSTHPAPENREARIAGQIVALGPGAGTGVVERDSYLDRLDGMMFGPNPREGYFEENVFLHPDMKLRFVFPEGWQTKNAKAEVSGLSPSRDAVVQVALSSKTTPEEAAREFFAQGELEHGPVSREAVHGLPAVWGDFAAAPQGSVVLGKAGFVAHEGRVFRLLAYTPSERWPAYEDVFERALRSFERVTDPRVLSVQPARIEIVRLDRPMSLEEFATRYHSTITPETLAAINHVRPGGRFEAGQKVKRVVGGP